MPKRTSEAHSRAQATDRHASCGCEVSESPSDNGKRAIGVNPEIKAANLRRLKRLEGQIRGLQRMVEEDRYCPDIMIQISASQEALRTVGRELMRSHLQHCVTSAITHGSGQDAAAMLDEIAQLFYKHSR